MKLSNSRFAVELITAMVDEKETLGSMTDLTLADCQLSDAAAQYLDAFKQLKHLDLSGNPITGEALYFVDELPALESLNLENTDVGWWMKRKVRRLMRLRHDSKPVTPFDS